MTGEVRGKVALASKAEVRAAVENAKAAQPEWASTNLQRRARSQKDALRGNHE
jgi:malonate-semialdehyde dehydrogenase (acetylating)/methylmalonate-semialdehyde dehydrogenase